MALARWEGLQRRPAAICLMRATHERGFVAIVRSDDLTVSRASELGRRVSSRVLRSSVNSSMIRLLSDSVKACGASQEPPRTMESRAHSAYRHPHCRGD